MGQGGPDSLWRRARPTRGGYGEAPDSTPSEVGGVLVQAVRRGA